jgi:hypothetical protein
MNLVWTIVLIVIVLLVLGYVIHWIYSSNEEVYVYDIGRYGIAKSDIPEIEAKTGAKVATMKQVEDAFKDGAQWCWAGWMRGDDGNLIGGYPMQTALPGCGDKVGVVSFVPKEGAKYSVLLYGKKPVLPMASKDNIGAGTRMWSDVFDPPKYSKYS